jgi:hypothetical protein
MAACVALDVIGSGLVFQCHYTNTTRFLLLPLDAESETMDCLPLIPKLLPVPLEIGKGSTGKVENQILIAQTV